MPLIQLVAHNSHILSTKSESSEAGNSTNNNSLHSTHMHIQHPEGEQAGIRVNRQLPINSHGLSKGKQTRNR